MIYLNRDFTNAGLISCIELNEFDIKIEEKIDIDIIKKLFFNYRILKPKFGHRKQKNGKVCNDFANDRAKGLVFPNTIINIYKHKDDILN